MSGYPAGDFVIDGEPGKITGSAHKWTAFGTQATDASAQIRSLDTSLFVGTEGDLYRSGLTQNLPPHLDTTGQAYTKVGGALATFASALSRAQSGMSPLASKAPGLWQAVQNAQGNLASAQSADQSHAHTQAAAKDALKPGQTLPPDTYQSGTSSASAALSSAQQAWDDCHSAALKLKSDVNTAADTCHDIIRDGSGMRFKKNPSGWGAFTAGFKSFVKDHVQILSKISSVLKTISAVAGLLSFIPVIGEIAAPIALIAGAGALGIDASIKYATGQGSWKSIIIDGALMALPGVGKLGKMALTTRTVHTAADGTQTIVKVENALVRTRVSVTNGKSTFSQVLPRGTKVHFGEAGSPLYAGKAPAAKGLYRSTKDYAYKGVRVSSSKAQNKLAYRTLNRLERASARDTRVDQAQLARVDGQLRKVAPGRSGVRPDIQTNVGGQRIHYEFDRPTSRGVEGSRAGGHVDNKLTNDPNSIMVTVPSGPPLR